MVKPFPLGCALGLTLLAFAGCANDSEVVIELGGDSSASPPTLSATDGGTDAASPAPVDPTLMCIGTECPAPWSTCPSWDGNVPQKCSTNLLNDDMNCGACGNECPDMYETLGMRTRCVNGACQRECWSSKTRDCNGMVDDGCEIDVSNDADNCGTCGKKCPNGTRCHSGQCGCPAGQTDCGEAEGCVDTSRNDWHCGACGVHCEDPVGAPVPPEHMAYGCGGSECGRLHCTTGWREAWADCNGDGSVVPSDGCEINTATDPNNCGTCGNKCAPGQICLSDGMNPPKCACDPGQTLCGDTDAPWCADLQNDAANCGTCGHPCAGGPWQGSPVCRKGFCEYACDQGWGDCDEDPSNGCETNLRTSGANCGACGARCDTSAGQPCVEGKCLTVECDGGIVK